MGNGFGDGFYWWRIQPVQKLPGFGSGSDMQAQGREVVVHGIERRAKGTVELLVQLRLRMDGLRQAEHHEAILGIKLEGAHPEPRIEPVQHQAGAGNFLFRHFHGNGADDLEHGR